MTQSCFVFILRSDGFYWLGALSTRLALSNETALEYFTLVNMWTVRKQALGPNSARSAGLSTGSALTERLINERGKCHIQASGAKHFDLPHKSLCKIMRFPVTRVSVHTASHTRFTKWVGYCFKRICSVSKRKCTRRWNVRHENTQTSTSLTFML